MSVCELRKRAHNNNNYASKLGYSRFINNVCTVLINLQESTYMYINYFASIINRCDTPAVYFRLLLDKRHTYTCVYIRM